MPSPDVFFRTRAKNNWQRRYGDGYTMNGTHHFFAKIPWTNRRIILARDVERFYVAAFMGTIFPNNPI